MSVGSDGDGDGDGDGDDSTVMICNAYMYVSDKVGRQAGREGSTVLIASGGAAVYSEDICRPCMERHTYTHPQVHK